MATGENFLQQLKNVVDPLMVFSHYLSLKKSGSRYRALCPFHSEKTPSFYVSENGMFHCFGCGVGGDLVKFVMLLEKMDFKETADLLSARYGIPLRFSSPAEKKEKDRLLEIMRQSADFYHNLLTTNIAGKEALDYLEKRGIETEVIRQFFLGWALSSWNSLIEHFEKKGIETDLLEKCGLAVPRHSQGYYDRYRGRVMIPIHDIHGNIIAFGGRILNPTGDEAKYLNSPESTLYSKSHQLFGLYYSKEEIQQKKYAILVEGYFDLILPYAAGFRNIVASLGTSLTEGQAKLLRRYTDKIVLFYDPDKAGKSAVLRALPILLQENFLVHVATLPEGKDPDSFVRSTGPEAFQEQIDKALRYDQLVLKNIQEKYDLKSSTDRFAATDEILKMLVHIENPFERVHLINAFAASMTLDPAMIHEQYRRIKSSGRSMRPPSEELQDDEKKLLQFFLIDPSIASEVMSHFEEQDYNELKRADIFRQINQVVCEAPNISTSELLHLFSPDVQNFLSSLLLEKRMPEVKPEYAWDGLEKIRKRRKDRQLRQLAAEIKRAEDEGNHEQLHELLHRKQSLGKEVRGKDRD